MKHFIFSLLAILAGSACFAGSNLNKEDGLPVYYWQQKKFVNFGDYLSLVLVERIVGQPVKVYQKSSKGEKKLLAVGSVLICADSNDVIWGTGMNGKRLDLNLYKFSQLDVKAVRGPKTRDFLVKNFKINCPEIYGDPVLLFPYLFPEFKKNAYPRYGYIIIPHYSEIPLFPKSDYPNLVYPTDPWDEIIRKILDSQFVISSSLHGLVVAEAYGIPARYLRISDHEPLYKYEDYYWGTGRSLFEYAASVDEALKMGGEKPARCDVQKLYESFPFEYWPKGKFNHPDFTKKPF